jgi:hypothetical protein
MARPKSAVGELGTVQVTRLASGLFRARGRVRDDGGAVHQLRAAGETEGWVASDEPVRHDRSVQGFSAMCPWCLLRRAPSY